MQQSLSVVLERNSRLRGAFATEPYEVAWAREARWFVRILDLEGAGTRLEATTQISPDGLHWCDLDDRRVDLRERGLASWPAREFGGWLRLRGSVTGDPGTADAEPMAKVLIYLVLKS
jgi:hypothetical protein